MVKKTSGILLLALTGLSAPFWFSATRANQQTGESRQPLQTRQAVLQQIPPRVKPESLRANPPQKPVSQAQKSDVITGEMVSQLTPEEILTRLVGRWEQTKSTSRQILTIEENGKATMIVEPQGLWTAVLGDRVTINIEWSLNQGKLTLKTVGGSPESKVDYIKQLWGEEFVREIHSIENKMFTLRDDSGEVNQKWIRTSY